MNWEHVSLADMTAIVEDIRHQTKKTFSILGASEPLYRLRFYEDSSNHRTVSEQGRKQHTGKEKGWMTKKENR